MYCHLFSLWKRISTLNIKLSHSCVSRVIDRIINNCISLEINRWGNEQSSSCESSAWIRFVEQSLRDSHSTTWLQKDDSREESLVNSETEHDAICTTGLWNQRWCYFYLREESLVDSGTEGDTICTTGLWNQRWCYFYVREESLVDSGTEGDAISTWEKTSDLWHQVEDDMKKTPQVKDTAQASTK
jgi:hypothetical protein